MTDTYSASTSVACPHPITHTNYFPLPEQIFDQINISQGMQIYNAFLCEKSVKFIFFSNQDKNLRNNLIQEEFYICV